MDKKRVVIFAGPSMFGTCVTKSASAVFDWRPPVRRGDIEQILTEEKTPGVIGIADGTFHAYPSVGHIEIREAMESGWTVFGMCSMGAIRAAEMAHMGVIPWGKVAKLFCEHPDTPDDEVALVHGSEPPYVPFSEPLIHIKSFLSHLRDKSDLNDNHVEEITNYFSRRWYGERTLNSLHDQILKTTAQRALPEVTRDALDNFMPYRTKQTDLVSFVTHRPWEAL